VGFVWTLNQFNLFPDIWVIFIHIFASEFSPISLFEHFEFWAFDILWFSSGHVWRKFLFYSYPMLHPDGKMSDSYLCSHAISEWSALSGQCTWYLTAKRPPSSNYWPELLDMHHFSIISSKLEYNHNSSRGLPISHNPREKFQKGQGTFVSRRFGLGRVYRTLILRQLWCWACWIALELYQKRF
jgi:hypothetical protein